MISDLPNGLEAQKLINISLGKIAASRSGRTGASLHKSLLVASVLHKARFVYLEEAQTYHHGVYCPPQGHPEEFAPEPPRAPTPLPEVTVTPVLHECDEKLHLDNDSAESLTSEENCSECLTNLDYNSKKRRRVSDQETEAAVSSILPKKLKADSEKCSECYYTEQCEYETEILCSVCGFDPPTCTCSAQTEEVCSMEVDHITSLVSIFSFNQQQSDLCSTQAHAAQDSVGPPVLALTA